MSSAQTRTATFRLLSAWFGRPAPSGAADAVITSAPDGPNGETRVGSPCDDADHALAALYRTHYSSLVGLAALLVRDVAAAEKVVQDSYVAMHSAGRRLADSGHALSFLHQSVVHRSRAALRDRVTGGRAGPAADGRPGAGPEAVSQLAGAAVVSALRALPVRQREAVVLRYYADLTETQIASAMGTSQGAVRSHIARAMAALQTELRPSGG